MINIPSIQKGKIIGTKTIQQDNLKDPVFYEYNSTIELELGKNLLDPLKNTVF